MSQEHQEYIQSKVNPILESLVTEVLLERPENPVPFMVRWLAEHSKKGKDALYSFGVGEAERLRNEISELQEEIKTLSTKATDPAASSAGPAEEAAAPEEKPAADADSEESDGGLDDDEEEFRPPPSYYQKGQRASVSAEAYGAFNVKQAFEPPVYSKTEEQEARIRQVTARSFLFNTLDKNNLSVIVSAFLEKQVASGERIIQEGDDGDCMFLIESGEFDCIKLINGDPKVVKKCGQGDVFGELALLYNCPRAASVEATTDATVWSLDRGTFGHIVRDASAKRREMFMDFLKAVPLFNPLESYDLMELADCLQKKELKAGELAIKQGDHGDTFYLVEEGSLVAKKSVDGTEAEVMKYNRGDYFGELSLIHQAPRAASVEAVTDCTIMSVDSKSFKNILGKLIDTMKENAAKQYS
mmetsp:Transcript_33723/g.61067  ORF Transcript_33723/g.61067 Transcript_33723/m.61067 type:complete len:415 (+) Transcript_33723:73-1317(+)|eukprot:CAMPEP_0197659092 /NCGR_PEP_ID=MMETSP1338-20131121/46238_1 /TAXON_ID=43686 ORGANISM="Pelagodinium beii, Strain RCC1491" /NCGR_SAMPLE_ID=MMETSP1338 /ASSEMBLY_ACC=CAM_ASM_000754 /LENGTH=414 /DNA_ID=CAMNT_0043235857 /DNA_START=73 /DNA_END=1317 /DNA_ORIENTATION=-